MVYCFIKTRISDRIIPCYFAKINKYMSKYVFKPYDEIMPILFKQEKERLLKFLKVEVIIEHVGSTAVPGLGGKGIIDICIAVNKDKMLIISSQIQKIGYEFKQHASVEDRLFHQIDLPDNKEGNGGS